ncbi:putative ribosome biogenesis GTPase RsgA [Rubripirellula obstinata]|uniref:Small ribosomal subunit biogenesis GTPase RsgA n=1 Tax=Rubripirellula obstinata TaxID=406547 RepID=A0A5B1CMJ9_9BACT|nr:ribosome small subunit-dependent GTPase A [Rubripirellula obstinata]KAA1260573.1 putative ribosome biogenesis GTPase RsgA [Rubripirellula obstinata]
MAKKKKNAKQRASFRKSHQGRVRDADLTRDYRDGKSDKLADLNLGERVSGKGDLTRKRTVVSDADQSDKDASATHPQLRSGRVISAHGLKCKVLDDQGSIYECAIRQVLKSLSIDGRSAVVAGDLVRFRGDTNIDGMIEHVEPRRGIISRTSRGQQHVLVANVDYLLIIASVAEPSLKPVLIDRFLLTASQCNVQPVLVLNKIDLVEPVSLQQLIGVYAAMGVRVLMTSAETGVGVDYLRHLIAGKQTALAGQSGVGKSSLLNAIKPGLGLAVGRVSQDNSKGRHTTTATTLIPLDDGGAVFDTPGIRQFKLWDISAEEVAGLMPDLRPYVSGCRYGNCLHLSEDDCAVKDAVADARIDARRYDAYCHLLESDLLLDE